MNNHKLKIENLPILTEELSHDELAAVKGGFSLTISGILSLFIEDGSVDLAVKDDLTTVVVEDDTAEVGVTV